MSWCPCFAPNTMVTNTDSGMQYRSHHRSYLFELNGDGEMENFNRVRQLLEKKRSELISGIDAAKARQRSIGDSNPDHFDLAMDFVSRERRSIMISRMEAQLEQVEAALQRLEQGSYGCCTNCGNQISDARLKALPYTPLCLECQREQERLAHR